MNEKHKNKIVICEKCTIAIVRAYELRIEQGKNQESQKTVNNSESRI